VNSKRNKRSGNFVEELNALEAQARESAAAQWNILNNLGIEA
jgi:hypothetical protein